MARNFKRQETKKTTGIDLKMVRQETMEEEWW